MKSLKKRHSINKISRKIQSLKSAKHFHRCSFFHCKDNNKLLFRTIFLNFKDFTPEVVFIMRNKRNRRWRRIESQSSDRDGSTPDTRLIQSNATLINVSEKGPQ